LHFRLANHFQQHSQATDGSASSHSIIPSEVPAFKLFNDCVTTLIEDRSNMSLPETLRLQTALTKFALRCYPNRMDYIAHCLGTSGALIAKTDFVSANSNSSDAKSEDETTVQIEVLLSAPLSTLALRVLDIPSYSKLMSYLPWGNWKGMI
jgi:vacuolar protein sorting-associated protein 35